VLVDIVALWAAGLHLYSLDSPAKIDGFEAYSTEPASARRSTCWRVKYFTLLYLVMLIVRQEVARKRTLAKGTPSWQEVAK
jgi:hypothetical protein